MQSSARLQLCYTSILRPTYQAILATFYGRIRLRPLNRVHIPDWRHHEPSRGSHYGRRCFELILPPLDLKIMPTFGKGPMSDDSKITTFRSQGKKHLKARTAISNPPFLPWSPVSSSSSTIPQTTPMTILCLTQVRPKPVTTFSWGP